VKLQTSTFVGVVTNLYVYSLSVHPTSTCYGPQRGYTIPPSVVLADGLPTPAADMLDPRLTSLLVLHPLCAGLAMLCTIFLLFSANRPLSITALTFSIWNAILATVAFVVDVVLVTTAKNRVDQGILIVYWGAVPWMTLVAAIFIWISVVLLSIRTWKYGRRPKPMEGQSPLFLI
jgi:hypothetical protein